MINIFQNIIEKYVNDLTTKDLESFAKSKDLKYTNDELLIVYQFIKYNYKELLKQNIKVFELIKEKVNPILYKQLINLYIEYKQKYL